MKILTIGTGVIGTIYSSVLTQAGCDVTHFVRPGKASVVNPDVVIDLLDRRQGHRTRSRTAYHYQLTEQLAADNDYDYILIAVRVCQLKALLSDLAGRTGGACCVIFTGQWQDSAWIEEYLPGSFIFADGIGGGRFNGDVLEAALDVEIPLGEVDGNQSPRLLGLGQQFAQAGIRPVYYSHILHWHWVQYALNAAMWGALVRAGSVMAAAKDKELADTVLRATAESLELCRQRGVDLAEFPELAIFTQLSGLKMSALRLGFRWTMRHSEYHRRCSLHGLDDPLEIKTFYNAVLQTGQAMGVPMPAYRSFRQDIDSL